MTRGRMDSTDPQRVVPRRDPGRRFDSGRLHQPSHDPGAGFRQTFCGPAALSALTGIPAETVARRIEHLTGPAEHLAGMHHWEMTAALKHFGLSHKSIAYGRLEDRPKRRRGWWAQRVTRDCLKGQSEVAWVGRPTLARWALERDAETYNSPCVLVISNHFVVVQGGDIADSVHGLMPLDESPYRRRRVHRATVIGRSD